MHLVTLVWTGAILELVRLKVEARGNNPRASFERKGFMNEVNQKAFATFYLYTDEAIDSPFVKAMVERLTVCPNVERPEEETRQDCYVDEWADAAVCLVHADDTHRILLHCGIKPTYNRYRKQPEE
jgi:hypothetical protein